MKEFRGSLYFARWRIPPWEILVVGPSSPTPVGVFAQALFRALVSSNGSDPRFISSMLDASQCVTRTSALPSNLFPATRSSSGGSRALSLKSELKMSLLIKIEPP